MSQGSCSACLFVFPIHSNSALPSPIPCECSISDGTTTRLYEIVFLFLAEPTECQMTLLPPSKSCCVTWMLFHPAGTHTHTRKRTLKNLTSFWVGWMKIIVGLHQGFISSRWQRDPFYLWCHWTNPHIWAKVKKKKKKGKKSLLSVGLRRESDLSRGALRSTQLFYYPSWLSEQQRLPF